MAERIPLCQVALPGCFALSGCFVRLLCPADLPDCFAPLLCPVSSPDPTTDYERIALRAKTAAKDRAGWSGPTRRDRLETARARRVTSPGERAMAPRRSRPDAPTKLDRAYCNQR